VIAEPPETRVLMPKERPLSFLGQIADVPYIYVINSPPLPLLLLAAIPLSRAEKAFLFSWIGAWLATYDNITIRGEVYSYRVISLLVLISARPSAKDWLKVL